MKELCTNFCQAEVALVAQSYSYTMINWSPARALRKQFQKSTEIIIIIIIIFIPVALIMEVTPTNSWNWRNFAG